MCVTGLCILVLTGRASACFLVGGALTLLLLRRVGEECSNYSEQLCPVNQYNPERCSED